MKLFIKNFMFSLLFCLTLNCEAQSVSDSIYHNRLYHVCKVWGYVKYFHTETANGNVDWDMQLINSVEAFKAAPTNSAFNDSLLQFLNSAGEMGINSNPLPNIIDSLSNNDFDWMHNAVFSDSVIAFLDTINTRFRPQDNMYVSASSISTVPDFSVDDAFHAESDYPEESKRILALFRYWNIINYFYPYKYIMDQDWDTTLEEFIPQIVQASDALEYHLAFKELTTRIDDSHSYFYSPYLYEWMGYYFPPFLARYIEDEMVITRVRSNVSEVAVGEIIESIDGVDIDVLHDSLRRYAHGSNEVIIDREFINIILRGDNGSFPVTVNNGTLSHTETLSRNSSNPTYLNQPINPIWQDTIVNDTSYYGIVDMGQLELEHIEDMFADLWETDAIIFDIRNYPNGTLWELVNYLYHSSINIANFTVPDITFPGRFYWDEEFIGVGAADTYQGEIILLFDERTQSQAEYTCMGLEQFENCTKIGSTTAAADGNVAQIYLPGNIMVYATFLGVFYPDYSPTQRIGIIPDVEMHPTIEGIRQGRDELMEYALGIEPVQTIYENNWDTLVIYPNPAQDKVYFTYPEQGKFLFEIFDMQGRQCFCAQLEANSGYINVQNLKKGLYLIKIANTKKAVVKKFLKD